MSETNKSFTSEEIAVLGSMLGKSLGSIDAVIVARSDLSWNTVRLHFNDLNVDINNHLGEIEVDELGSLEEFGLLSVARSPKTKLELPEVSAETSSIEVGKTITCIKIVSDSIVVYGEGSPVATITYPQAVILEHEDGVVVLDKECWFSEMIAVKQGKDAEDLIYDESVNWEDDPEEDPSTHFEFSTAIQTVRK